MSVAAMKRALFGVIAALLLASPVWAKDKSMAAEEAQKVVEAYDSGALAAFGQAFDPDYKIRELKTGAIHSPPEAMRVSGDETLKWMKDAGCIVTFGSAAAIDPKKEYWQVYYNTHGAGNSALALLDDKRTLLVVWIVPEG